VPCLMSSHPGSTLSEAIDLALYLKKKNIRPEQVQDFYPTPGTASTAMYYTGIDPFTGKHVYIPQSYEEKRMQRALLQSTKKENIPLVKKALELSHREDAYVKLIGGGIPHSISEKMKKPVSKTPKSILRNKRKNKGKKK